MSWIPSNEELVSEAENYNSLGFFSKSKNQLIVFILLICALTFFAMNLSGASGYGIVFNLLVAVFIYFNHRWAIVLFALMYVGDKVVLISMGASPGSQIIFGAIAVLLAYSAFKVATELKKLP